MGKLVQKKANRSSRAAQCKPWLAEQNFGETIKKRSRLNLLGIYKMLVQDSGNRVRFCMNCYTRDSYCKWSVEKRDLVDGGAFFIDSMLIHGTLYIVVYWKRVVVGVCKLWSEQSLAQTRREKRKGEERGTDPEEKQYVIARIQEENSLLMESEKKKWEKNPKPATGRYLTEHLSSLLDSHTFDHRTPSFVSLASCFSLTLHHSLVMMLMMISIRHGVGFAADMRPYIYLYGRVRLVLHRLVVQAFATHWCLSAIAEPWNCF